VGRGSEGILDELMTYCDGEITFKDVFDVLGLVDWRVMPHPVRRPAGGDVARQMTVVEEVITAGKACRSS
jgi:DNA polymerase-3 subunit gamma/tau